MSNDPILLIHWLEDSNDDREARDVFLTFCNEVNIRYRDVDNRDRFLAEVRAWLTEAEDAQFLFVGAHGDDEGLGDEVETGVDWPELGAILAKGRGPDRRAALWLGACESSGAATAWSPTTYEERPASYIVSFRDKVASGEILSVLRRLVEMTRMENLTFVDQELEVLEQVAGSTRINLHYPTEVADGVLEYLSPSQVVERIDMTLREYLTRKGRVPADSLLAEALDLLLNEGAAEDTETESK